MKQYTKATAAFISIILSTSVWAQNQTPPTPTCETDPTFKAFDFWIGDWNVTARNNGQFQGTNKISVIEGGCALREEWTSANGGTGQSINYYDPVTKLWRQLWVSAGAGGYMIDYSGGIQDGSMILEGEIHYYAQGSNFPFRGTWTPNKDGTVRQFFEQYNPETKKWSVWFDGLYAPQKK